MATHSSVLAWKVPWTEEPGGPQPMGLQSRTRLSDFACLPAWFVQALTPKCASFCVIAGDNLNNYFTSAYHGFSYESSSVMSNSL